MAATFRIASEGNDATGNVPLFSGPPAVKVPQQNHSIPIGQLKVDDREVEIGWIEGDGIGHASTLAGTDPVLFEEKRQQLVGGLIVFNDENGLCVALSPSIEKRLRMPATALR